MDAPHTADHSKPLGESAAWRKKLGGVIWMCDMLTDIITKEFSAGNKQVVEEVIKNGSSLLKVFDEARSF